MAERGRFAPTPSGRMHLGNVFSALLAWLSVRAAHGELVLRIEDLDTLRCSAENAEILKDDLRWLGLAWDAEQPDQSTRSEYYESILDRLRGEGFVYPCWCTRGDLKNAANAPHASDGHPIYPGTCRDLTEEERAAKAKVRAPLWRLRVHPLFGRALRPIRRKSRARVRGLHSPARGRRFRLSARCRGG